MFLYSKNVNNVSFRIEIHVLMPYLLSILQHSTEYYCQQQFINDQKSIKTTWMAQKVLVILDLLCL